MRVILVAAAILLAVPVQAAPVRLSEMTREQEVIMQSASYPTLMCMLNLIQEIKGYGGPEAEREFFVTYDESPMGVYSVKAGMYHTCVDGVHILRDDTSDGPIVLQIYDNDGEPTMDDEAY